MYLTLAFVGIVACLGSMVWAASAISILLQSETPSIARLKSPSIIGAQAVQRKCMNEDLYSITRYLLDNESVAAKVCKVEGHEVGDPDLLWLEYTPDDALSQGEYIAVEQVGADCIVTHNDAYNFGGSVTNWHFSGTEAQSIACLLTYLKIPPTPAASTEFAGLPVPQNTASISDGGK